MPRSCASPEFLAEIFYMPRFLNKVLVFRKYLLGKSQVQICLFLSANAPQVYDPSFQGE
jgi:hypothetical protein